MSNQLLLQIARCPLAEQCLQTTAPNHPCSTIVNSQDVARHDPTQFQVPEPWSGHIEHAPILFISSNPSISQLDAYPTSDWTDNDIVDFFENRFGGGRREWIRNGNKGLAHDGSYLRATAFWSSVRKRAEELLERDTTPGVDYALTEIVHCKSRKELGVREALQTCSTRYSEAILSLSGAMVLVVLGNRAASAIREQLGISDEVAYSPVEVAGTSRMVVFLPHPNAHRPRTFSACLSSDELYQLRRFLAQEETARIG